MTSPTQARRRVAIAGQVTDAATGKAVGGVNIVISDAPEIYIQKLRLIGLQFGTAWNTKIDRPDKTQTTQDGSFFFLDLPAGAYAIHASAPRLGSRFGVASANVAVAQDAQGNFLLHWITFSLPSTSLSGSVTSNNTGVSFAEIRIQGSGERAFSDGQGKYTIAGLEPGLRTVLVSAQGFRPASQSISIAAPGDAPALNFKLVRNAG